MLLLLLSVVLLLLSLVVVFLAGLTPSRRSRQVQAVIERVFLED